MPQNPLLPSPTVIVVGPGGAAAAAAAAAAASGRGNAVRPCQRPWAAALPMRSWRSDDSSFVGAAAAAAAAAAAGSGLEGRRSTTGDMVARRQLLHHASADADAGDQMSPSHGKVFVQIQQPVAAGFSPTASTASSSGATVIPIIISTPEETVTLAGSRSSSVDDDSCLSVAPSQQLSPYRRSSCPNPLLLRGVVPSASVSSAGGEDRPFFAPSLQPSAPNLSRRSSLQRSASISRKRRRENWLGIHQQQQDAHQLNKQHSSLYNLPQQQQQQQLQPNRYQQRRTSIQSQLSCEGVIDEEPEALVVVTNDNETTNASPTKSSNSLLTAPIPAFATEYRRKSTSAVSERTLSVAASSAKAVSVHRTATLDVPDPFFVVRSTSGLLATDAGASSTLRTQFDRDSGMSVTTGSVQSISSQ
jgi:hypothetical protein